MCFPPVINCVTVDDDNDDEGLRNRRVSPAYQNRLLKRVVITEALINKLQENYIWTFAWFVTYCITCTTPNKELCSIVGNQLHPNHTSARKM